MNDSSAGVIVIGFIVALFMCGFSVWAERDIHTATFGITRFEAAKLKESCEKSLPRDEKCMPKLTYEVK